MSQLDPEVKAALISLHEKMSKPQGEVMPGHREICSCGTFDDAYQTTIRAVETILKGHDCVVWHYAVLVMSLVRVKRHLIEQDLKNDGFHEAATMIIALEQLQDYLVDYYKEHEPLDMKTFIDALDRYEGS